MSFTKLKFQYQYFIIYLSIILVFWIDKLNAQDGFCSSPELTDNDWIFGISNERISATFEGGTLSELQMENILRINHTVLDNDNQHLYIDARLLENQILELYTTDFFHQYEENEDNLFMQLTIVFVCTNGATRSIFIRQDLLDENNHDPIFSLEQYSIVLPLPLPSGYEITLYQEIFTRDIDVNQNQITFTIEGTDLLTPRTIRGTQTNKISYLSLILNNQLLTIKESIDIIITATDNGQLLSRSTSANVTITGNSTVSFIPSPKFEKLIYKGNLYDNEQRTFDIESIILDMETFENGNVEFISNDMPNYFELNADTNTIEIVELPDGDLQEADFNGINYLTFQIDAIRNDEIGSTLIIFDIQRENLENITIPNFIQPIFIGNLTYEFEIMFPVAITLNEDIAENDIFIEFTGIDSDWFTIGNITNDIIYIEINATSLSLIENEIENREYFLFEIIATKMITQMTGSTVIMINTPKRSFGPQPQFEQSYYVATLNDNLQLNAINIVIIESTYTEDIEISKDPNSDDAGLFDYSLENNAIRITLNRTLTSNDIDGKINFVFILTASNSIGNSDRTIIIVNVPEINCEEILQFQNTHYNFWITQNDIGEIGRVSIKSSSTINVLYYLELNGYLESRLSINPETGVIITTNAITIGQHEFVVIARNDEDETAASVMLEILEDVQCPNPNNTIENMLLIRNLDEETEHLEILPVLVNDCIYQIQRMEPNDEEYFKIDRQTNQLTSIKIDRESNSFGTMAVPQIQITLKLLCGEDIPAEDEDDNEIETQIPDLDNDNNEELIPDDDEEEAVDNDIENNNNDDDDIENNNDDGDDVHDNEVEDNEDDINVQVPENNEDDVDVQLPENNEDDVDVQVPENNEDNVDVQIPENNEENVDVQIPENNEDDVDVQVPENNDDGNDVEQMPENNENIDDLDMENVEDNENRPENIDDIENDVQVPQPSPPPPPLPSPSSIENEIIVENKIKKNISKRSVKPKANQNLIKYINPNFDNRWFILTNGIPHHTDTTMLTVILNDINDNAPEFINPPIQPYLMGYPEPHIAERILIPYLIKCEVIDKDFGLNAQILYGLENNDHFEINSETGIIVPTQNAMTKINEIELIVHAHDRNGQSDGHRTDTNIIIKKLQAAHITVLTVSGDTNENVLESVLVHIRSETQLNIMVLHSSFISTNDPTTRQLFENQRANGQTTVLRIILYAFNDLGELLDTDQLQSALHTINSEYKIASYHDVLGSAVTDINDLVMIIVIAVLSVIFVVTAVGAFLMWWFLIRPYEYRKILETSSNASTADLKKEFGDSSPPPPERINRMNVYEDNEKRDSFNISGNTIGDTTDNENALEKVIDSNNIYNNKNYNKFNDANDDEDEYGRSKQNYKYGGNDTINNNNNNDNDENDKRDRMSQKVTFNELVERIDIETAVRDSDDEIRI